MVAPPPLHPPDQPVPEPFNASEYLLGRGARHWPARTALVLVDDGTTPAGAARRWTYGQLDESVRRVAAGLLDLGLEPGDRVHIRLPNTIEYALVHFGAMAAGLVSVPSSAQLTPAETAFLVRDSGARVVATEPGPDLDLPTDVVRISAEDVARWCREASPAAYVRSHGDDPAFLVYTSGTTGRPKGVLHGHRSTWGRRPMHAAWLGLREGDVLLHAGAFNWTYTLGVGLTDPWACGATAVLYTGPRDPGVWARLVEAHRATVFAAVPGVYRQLLRAPELATADLSSLRHGVVAGEALRPELWEQWTSRTGLPLYEALGMSEISTFISSGPGVPVRPGSPGRAQPGRRIAALSLRSDGEGALAPLPPGEVGLLAVDARDPGLMLGYWNRPDEEAQVRRGPWFVGGDLVAIGTDGYVQFHGRADDVMNAQGHRVSPVEVEEALADCPGVMDVAVTEVEVRPGVGVVTGFVVPDPTTDAHTLPERVLAHAAHRLARYKQPRRVVVVTALPRTPNGKILRRALAQGEGWDHAHRPQC